MDKSIPKQPLHMQYPKECLVFLKYRSVFWNQTQNFFVEDGEKTHYIQISLQAPFTWFWCRILKAESLVGKYQRQAGWLPAVCVWLVVFVSKHGSYCSETTRVQGESTSLTWDIEVLVQCIVVILFFFKPHSVYELEKGDLWSQESLETL